MPKLTLFSSRDTEPQLVRAAKKERPIWMKVAMGVLIFLLICTAVYLFCPYTKIQALVCSGNYYFTPQQIYGIANVSVNNRTYLHLPGQMAEKLEANPLIESANVSYDGQVVNIAIKEKMIIGYYEENGENYLLTSQGERIPVTNTSELRTLVHYPLLVDLTPEVMNEIAKEVREHPEELTRSVFEKVAEILPWQESYDKNMLKLVLQDGNTVFTSIPSLFMMSTYQQVLTNLQGESVCLMLDGDNGVVNNIGCSYIHLSPEERAENRQIPKSVLDPNVYPVPQASEENSQTSSQSDQAAANPDPAAQPNQDPAAASTQTPPSENQDPAAQTSQSTSPSTPSGEIPADLATIADWEASAVDYLQYSPSTNLFYNKENGIYYVYDTASDTFYPY